MNTSRPLLIALCGNSRSTTEEDEIGFAVGRLIAERNAVALCGGLGGIMSSGARGVTENGGVCIGLLPGVDANEGNEYLSYSIPTGMGEMRNGLLARSTAGMIAIGGGYGTLSEIGFARRLDKPVVCIGSWQVSLPGASELDPNIHWADNADNAVSWLWSQISH